MPVLLLARGDQNARDLLKKAIEARYGTRPPMIESMHIDFAGRTRARVGPITTWVPMEMTARFQLPSAMRWDFVAKPAGVSMRRGTESYDGEKLRSRTGNGQPTLIEDAAVIDAVQNRLWAIAALLLTPLGDHFVELTEVDDLTFTARNTQVNTSVYVHLQPDYRIDFVAVNTFNTEANSVQQLRLSTAPELTAFDDLLLPSQINASWDGTPWFEMSPSAAQNNPDIPPGVFTLSSEQTTA
jgi:hypothetical protein